MEPFVIVEAEVGGQPGRELSNQRIIHQIDVFVLDGAPEAFDKDVVKEAPAAIHADAHTGGGQMGGEGLGGELDALIRVEDFRCTELQRLL